ncbi:TolB family protein [Streptomyces sp. NPDC092296]|uniref:TolB family protein n=1 Tax=Streptomyces sp. NPDC092296 TaxID=3366012 RepID=UPI003806DE9B
MADRFWEFTGDGPVAERPLGRAAFLLVPGRPDGGEMLAGTDSGGLVRVPGMSPESVTRPLALSRDGARVVLCTGRIDRPERQLVVRTLATGEQRVFDALADGTARYAALSPDGGRLAVLSDDASEVHASVTVTDLAGGAVRRLWLAEGEASAEGAVSWSPDGRLLAVTYLADGEFAATAILEVADGRQLAFYDELLTLGSANGSWSDDRELVLVEEDPEEDVPPLFVRDVLSGGTVRHDWNSEQRGGVLAVWDGRLVHDKPGVGLCTTAFDGSDPRPLLRIDTTGWGIWFFDLAPGALTTFPG